MSMTVLNCETPTRAIDHPDAAEIEIQEGHLVLFDNNGKAIAMYAPGYWASAAAAQHEESP